jgi:predicted metal-dependent hydrolase
MRYRDNKTGERLSITRDAPPETPRRRESMIAYTLTRQKRKTIALYVLDSGVEVRAPLKAAKSDIDEFVASKEKWISDKRAQANERRQQREAFSLGYGDKVLYLGKEYPISAKPGGQIGFDGERFYMPPDLGPAQIKHACEQAYRMLAKRALTEKVLDYAKRMGVAPSAVKVNGAKSRWGSCSGKKSLNFSWRLIMAGDDVVDYVVVHELAHITEMNHSERFWAVVAAVLPDYLERRKRLRAHALLQAKGMAFA